MSQTYSRSYQTLDDEAIKIPEGYDGNAFRQESEPIEEAKGATAKDNNPAEPVGAFGGGMGDGLFSLFDKFPVGKIFSGLGGSLPKLRMPEIHGEEILIIALAAFLFFSKSGDKESAFMLLLLLLF